MLNFIKQYCKLLIALLYAIFVPLYFYQSTHILQKSLDISRDSSEKQINILQNSLEEQTQYYDKLFEEYQSSLETEQAKYDESLKVIKETQILQQKQLSKRFKESPSSISDELSKRYGLNGE